MTERDNFEEQLLERLRGVVAERPAPRPRNGGRRRSSRLVLAGAAGAAGVAAVAVVAGSGGVTPSAYAVESHPDGTVTVAVTRLSDASGLQSTLREAGVPAVVDYSDTEAAEPGAAPAPEAAAEPGVPTCDGESESSSGVAPTVTVPLAEGELEVTPAVPTEPAEGDRAEASIESEAPVRGAPPVEVDAPSAESVEGSDAEPSFTIDPAKIGADEFVYIVTSPEDDGKYLTVRTVAAEVGCEASEPAVPASGE